MLAHTWSLLGLLLDMVGVLLLSVEAIKLQNVRRLRERLLVPLHQWSKPQPIQRVSVDDPQRHSAASGCRDFAWWFVTHAGSGAITVFLVGRSIAKLLPAVAVATTTYWQWLSPAWKVAAAILLAVLSIWPLVEIGELWHRLLVWATGRFIAALDFVDARTPDGTIGVIGLMLAVTGFALQFIGTWLARPQ